MFLLYAILKYCAKLVSQVTVYLKNTRDWDSNSFTERVFTCAWNTGIPYFYRLPRWRTFLALHPPTRCTGEQSENQLSRTIYFLFGPRSATLLIHPCSTVPLSSRSFHSFACIGARSARWSRSSCSIIRFIRWPLPGDSFNFRVIHVARVVDYVRQPWPGDPPRIIVCSFIFLVELVIA